MECKQFEPADYQALCNFFITLNRDDRTHVNWNWARFEWMYEHPEFDKSALSAMGLWWEAGRIVGAAVYDMYFGEAFCGVLPGFEALYPEVLRYAWERLRDENGLGVAVCDTNRAEQAVLAALGFVPAEQTENVMRLCLDGLETAPLPAGLRVVHPDPVRDAEALQWLFWRGFDHGEDRAVFQREEEIVPRIRPHFDPRLSLAAADGAGELAACCCLWLHPGTDYAYVEPVCTVPAWRGRGVARALLNRALNEAASLGAKEAWVISDLPFYQKLGFENAYRYRFYWKTREEPQA